MEHLSKRYLFIRKRTISQWMLYFLFFFPLIQAALSEFLPIPNEIRFLCDGCIFLLLLKMVLGYDLRPDRFTRPFLILTAGMMVYTLVVYLFRFQSPFYFIWGFRSTFRFFLAFLAFVLWLDWEDCRGWMRWLEYGYHLNFLLILVQFAMGYRQDYLGGLFGVQKGCNGSLFIFLSIVVAWVVLAFLRGECSTAKIIYISVTALLNAAFSELKIFFLVFLLILLAAAAVTRTSMRKLFLMIFSAVCVILFSMLLVLLYENFRGFLSMKGLWEALSNPVYSMKQDVGRFTAIPVISRFFLPDLADQLFGLGLGNCDTSSLAIFNTPFAQSYYLLHYSYFTYAFLYLETGLIGLTLYLGFFLLAGLTALRLLRQKLADPLVCQLAIITAMICVILMIYNSALRTESACLVFFVLALPLVSARRRKYPGGIPQTVDQSYHQHH